MKLQLGHESFFGRGPRMFGDSEYYYDPSEPELTPRSSQEGNEKVITASTIIFSKLALTPQERELGVSADNAFMGHLSGQHKQNM